MVGGVLDGQRRRLAVSAVRDALDLDEIRHAWRERESLQMPRLKMKSVTSQNQIRVFLQLFHIPVLDQREAKHRTLALFAKGIDRVQKSLPAISS